MSLTLLVDLDNTLLLNAMESFVPAYLQAISRHLAPALDPGRVAQSMLAGTKAMVTNRRPDRTLKQVFDARFYPELGIQEADYREIFADYYARSYPGLRQLTQPNPQAPPVISQAFARGYQIVIATNPLFPLTAIQQRVEWAGFPLDEFPFALIPSYETFHFAKPDPAYLAELLGRLGWPETPVVMVGDNPVNDIRPARQLGLPAYLVTAGPAVAPDGSLGPSASGELSGLLDWIDQAGLEYQNPAEKSAPAALPPAMLAGLRATPAALAGLCEQVSEPFWSQRSAPGEWCQTEILCHLRDVEREVNLPRLRRVVQEDNPFITGQDTDPWAVQRRYIEQDGPQALRDFTAARIELLGLLETLSPDDWQRPARHTIFGPTTLSELASIAAAHDRLHLQQVLAFIQSLEY